MKSKLELLTKINSLILIVVFTIVLLPTCKQNDAATQAVQPQRINGAQPSTAKQQFVRPLFVIARYFHLK